jgi:hypothetical protein
MHPRMIRRITPVDDIERGATEIEDGINILFQPVHYLVIAAYQFT